MITILAGTVVGNVGSVEIYEVNSRDEAAQLKADLKVLSNGATKLIFRDATASVADALQAVRQDNPGVKIAMIGC